MEKYIEDEKLLGFYIDIKYNQCEGKNISGIIRQTYQSRRI